VNYYNHQNIYLIGMPSSGKSTLGLPLAERLGYQFIDTDSQIVEKEGRSIAQIFENNGEDHFRTLEKANLHEQKIDARLVISTGGGMPCSNNNIKYMLATGVCVFLNVPLEELANRLLISNKNERPLLSPGDAESLVLQLTEKYAQREHIYKQAQIILEAPFAVENLLRHLKNYWKKQRSLQ
jgi:shikimate kinase